MTETMPFSDAANKYHALVTARGHPEYISLFPDDDAVLADLAECNAPFQKHVDGVLSTDCFATGARAAAERGIDFRYFATPERELVGALRFGDRARIDAKHGTFRTVHGGAVETVLDEATAEACKLVDAPNCATHEFSIKLKKPALPDTTYEVHARVLSVRGFRVFTEGTITRPDGTVVAEAKATLINLTALQAL